MLISRFAWIQTVQTISEGCGFLYVAGHGSPESFVTHHPHNEEYYIYGLNTYNMDPISNGHRLPICVVGGCHNSEFNVSFTEFTKNIWNYVPTFECWSWKLASLRGGGSIATIGCTGLGIGAIGDYNDDGIPDCIQAVAGWLEPQFFHAYGVQGKDVLGDAHSTAIIDYINTFPCDSDRSDAKSVQEWVLLGDPSLKIGGYT
jgi:hypothetical protein